MDSENNNIIEDENSAQVNIAQLNPAEESKQNFVSYVWDENIIPYQNYEYNTKKQNKRLPLIVFIVLISLIGICLMTIFTYLYGNGDYIDNIFSDKEVVNITIPIQEKPDKENSFYDDKTGKYTAEGIAEKVLPSVVSIEIFENGVAFTPTGQGSGIILTENGYIITNAHVIENASRAIKVVLNNEEEYEAKVIGSDTKTDIAVIKISAKNLTAADIGDSDELKIGEDIIALGSPAGLYGSLTKGVVSGLDRMVRTDESNIEMNCIQIDAAINPGNSGGALVNMYGQVVGINSSKIISESYDGIGFAISMKAAKPIIEQLMENGYVKDRVRVGIVYFQITPDTAKMNSAEPGLCVVEIDPECDVANTELEINDIITHLNGFSVLTADDIQKALEGKKPGDVITAEVFRLDIYGNSTTFEISFKLMEDLSSAVG